MKEKLLLIYNPVSGQQLVGGQLGDIVLSLQEKWDVTIRPTASKGHAEQIAAEEGGRYDVMVAAGGDGTVHEVVNGMMRARQQPVLGILPGGTANDIARTLQIPLTLLEACEFIKTEEPKFIDIGKYGERYFMNFLGLGLISTVSKDVKNETKTYLRHFTYYIKSLQHMQNNQLFHVTIETEKRKIEADAVMVYVANGQSLAGLELFTDNEMNTGQFEVAIVRNVGLSEIISVASSYIKSEPIEHEAFYLFKADSLSIHCDPPQLIDTDGEKEGQTPVSIELLREKMRVIGHL
jgi:diacylglycerol kinase (ATP)